MSAAFVREVVGAAMRHDVPMWSAVLAYQGLFSLFPFLIFLRALFPYIPGAGRLLEEARVLAEEGLGAESELYRIVEEYVFSEFSAEAGSALLSLGVVLSLYSASTVLATMIRAINLAYGRPEHRPWVHRRLIGVLLALWLAVLLSSSLVVIALGPWLAGSLAAHLPGEGLYRTLAGVSRWPLALVLSWAALVVVYHVAPVERHAWRWSVPGSLVGVTGIVTVSAGFSWYLSSGVFEPGLLTYGVIGTVMVLLFWMYLVSASVLVGGEVNATVWRLATGDGAASAGLASGAAPG